MKVLILHSEKDYEYKVANAFAKGMSRHGDQGEMATDAGSFAGYDAVAMMGVKSIDTFKRCRSEGVQTIMLDKGYVQPRAMMVKTWWNEWRISVNAQHSTEFVRAAKCDSARLRGLKLAPWREGANILIAGSSEKYHRFHGLPHPTEYARWIVAELKLRTDRPIIYRPKPSWKDAEPVSGARFNDSKTFMIDALRDVHCVVSHGSNACVDAIMNGVPCIVLGDGVASPISSHSLDDIEKPYRAPFDVRRQWLQNITYCNWTPNEMADGHAWPWIRNQLR